MRHRMFKTRTIPTALGVGMVLFACSAAGLSACTAETPPAYAEAYPYGYYPYDDPFYRPYGFGFGFSGGGFGVHHHGFHHGHSGHPHAGHPHAGHSHGGHGGGHAGGGHR